MTEGFDKEIDALLRQTAQGESASGDSKFRIPDSKSPHLDGEEISLFAENALPAKMRQTAIAHFADCDRCREILSNVIAENAAVETVSTAAPIELFPVTIPWYRKLFAFPNLAYTLGSLVIVFAGIIGFTVLQSVKNTQNSEVSQVSERQLNGKGASSDGEAMTVERANSNMMMANSMSNASMSNSASLSSPGSAMSNSAMNSAATAPGKNSATNSAANSSTGINKSTDVSNSTTENETQSDSSITAKQLSELPLNGRATNNFTLQKPAAEKKAEESRTDDNETITVNAPPKAEQPTTSTADAASKSDPSKAKSVQSGASSLSESRKRQRFEGKSGETRQIGGKTFERKDNVWIDATYKNQSTINVSRGTETFIRLDSGLRSIAENLGGTIIIVWKDKAYRIQ